MPTPDEINPQMLLEAYRQGAFPMAESRHGRVRWYTADPRAILPLDGLRVSRSLRKRVRRGDYRITRDQAFEQVIRACAQPRPYAAQTWINDQIISAYTALHRLGPGHSVEAWIDHTDAQPTLVGGLYGVAIGGAFFGESMFSRATDASKVCLVHLVDHLRSRGYALLDVQFSNPHMEQFGIIEIPRRQYLAMLREAMAQPVTWE